MSKTFITTVLALALCYVNGEMCKCPKIVTPVCGSDYQTYINTCEFNCARRVKTDLTIAYNGGCKRPKMSVTNNNQLTKCSCPMEFSPVCGTNGRTYTSPCFLECEQSGLSDLKIAHNGVCKTPKASSTKKAECSCTTEYSPVCGSNGRTYSSPCYLECDQQVSSDLKIAHVGSCNIAKVSTTKKGETVKCSCPMEFSPVCGSNGRTYSSPCYLECDQSVTSDLKITHNGVCKTPKASSTKKAECSCTTEYSPVCGSNGRTYSSPCYLECDQQVSSDLKIAHVGSCNIAKVSTTKKGETVKCSCPMEFSPVCGSNGRTYSSPCYLECDQSVTSDLKITHNGVCKTPKASSTKKAECSCTTEYSPVCGSNGRTYSSPCYLECDQQVSSDLKIAHVGSCNIAKVSTTKKGETVKCSCPMEFSPVCGSNGRTYSSPCYLECDQSVTSDLKITHNGVCKTPKASSTKKAECSCTTEYSPVCGSNGRTYSSPCYLECEKQVSSDLKIAHVGSCQIAKVSTSKKDESAKCSCTMEFSPVCGSNGRTYSSPCYLECDQSMTSDLKIAHNGVCKTPKALSTRKDEASKCSCTMEFSPVCGSNGRTYSSPCLLECEQNLNTGLRLSHEGPCA